MDATLTITTPSDREVLLTRVFDAPRALVFDAWTRPDLLRRWYGPHGWSLVVCDVDLTPGGGFRFVSRRPDGREVGQRGVYQEIARPARLVHTEEWEDWNPGACLVTVELVEEGGRTRVTSRTLFPTSAVRDTVLESGLRHGAEESFARLEALLGQAASSAASVA